MTPDTFIKMIAPAAQASSKITRIPASFTVAEAALESGWGASALVTEACNLFGVKADASWLGDTVMMPTREYLNGQWVTVPAKWRKYPTWLASINDHAQFLLKNPRYQGAFVNCSDVEAFTNAIAKAGYATDPQYASKILAIIKVHNLAQFDAS